MCVCTSCFCAPCVFVHLMFLRKNEPLKVYCSILHLWQSQIQTFPGENPQTPPLVCCLRLCPCLSFPSKQKFLGRTLIDFFTRITNIRCCEKTVTLPPKPVEETIYIGAYNSRLQLITSRTRIIDESIDQTKVGTVDSGVLEHLLKQVNELQTDLEAIIRELLPLRHEGKPLPEAIGLDKVLRKLEITLTQMISRHQKLTELLKEDEDAKSTSSDHSVPAKATTRIKLPKLSIPKFDGDVLNWRTFWEQFGILIHCRPELSNAEKLAYLKDALKDGPAERVIQGLAQTTGTYDEAIECLLN